jgi:hypothetical protein
LFVAYAAALINSKQAIPRLLIARTFSLTARSTQLKRFTVRSGQSWRRDLPRIAAAYSYGNPIICALCFARTALILLARVLSRESLGSLHPACRPYKDLRPPDCFRDPYWSSKQDRSTGNALSVSVEFLRFLVSYLQDSSWLGLTRLVLVHTALKDPSYV